MKPVMEIGKNGAKLWYVNGRHHREDGPAIEQPDGTKQWWINGKRHREDGPAIEDSCGTNQWYINGKNITKKVNSAIQNKSLRPYENWTEMDILKFKIMFL